MKEYTIIVGSKVLFEHSKRNAKLIIQTSIVIFYLLINRPTFPYSSVLLILVYL